MSDEYNAPADLRITGTRTVAELQTMNTSLLPAWSLVMISTGVLYVFNKTKTVPAGTDIQPVSGPGIWEEYVPAAPAAEPQPSALYRFQGQGSGEGNMQLAETLNGFGFVLSNGPRSYPSRVEVPEEGRYLITTKCSCQNLQFDGSARVINMTLYVDSESDSCSQWVAAGNTPGSYTTMVCARLFDISDPATQLVYVDATTQMLQTDGYLSIVRISDIP